MRYILFLFGLMSAAVASDPNHLKNVFANIPIDGTIYVESLNTQKIYTYNDVRSRQQFTVASTFKIPNTLIALQEKLASPKTTFNWSGNHYAVSDWNADQTLESAFKLSCVWCYQRLATRIGADTYRKYLTAISYGSLPSNIDLTHFWLDGSLQLSAVEQVKFLQQLYSDKFPFDKKHTRALQMLMKVEATDSYTLYAKSGWSPSGKYPVGWYVGYVKTEQDTWFFATNLAITKARDLPLRKRLTLEALDIIGAIHL